MHRRPWMAATTIHPFPISPLPSPFQRSWSSKTLALNTH
jgi:hypothetical protein